jgi:Fe-S-cluster-containing dehydrogenase component
MDKGNEGFNGVERFINRTTSRREFLKIGGKGVAGTVLTGPLLSFLSGCATTGVGTGKKVVWATASGAVIHNIARCSGCRRCETNCTISNDGKAHPYIARIKIGRNLNFGPKGPTAAYWTNDGQLGNLKIYGETCRQCEDPYCGNACPVGAIVVDPKTKARVVVEATCIGCGICMRACPWGMATLDPEEQKSKKCLLCHGDPECARYCPNGAIKFMPWGEAIKLYKSHWETHI